MKLQPPIHWETDFHMGLPCKKLPHKLLGQRNHNFDCSLQSFLKQTVFLTGLLSVKQRISICRYRLPLKSTSHK